MTSRKALFGLVCFLLGVASALSVPLLNEHVKVRVIALLIGKSLIVVDPQASWHNGQAFYFPDKN